MPADANRSIKLADNGQTCGIGGLTRRSRCKVHVIRPTSAVNRERNALVEEKSWLKINRSSIAYVLRSTDIPWASTWTPWTAPSCAFSFSIIQLHCTRASSSIVTETFIRISPATVGNIRCLIVNEAISLFLSSSPATSQLPLRDQLFLHLNRAVIYGKVLAFFERSTFGNFFLQIRNNNWISRARRKKGGGEKYPRIIAPDDWIIQHDIIFLAKFSCFCKFFDRTRVEIQNFQKSFTETRNFGRKHCAQTIYRGARALFDSIKRHPALNWDGEREKRAVLWLWSSASEE